MEGYCVLTSEDESRTNVSAYSCPRVSETVTKALARSCVLTTGITLIAVLNSV